MNVRFAARMAWREGRGGLRRAGVVALSIALGVAALVAVHSFRDDITRSIDQQAEALLGADVRLASDQAFPDSLLGPLDSLARAGAGVAYVTTVGTMVLAPSNGAVRLLQVRSVRGAWPFYGEVRTAPAGLWGGRWVPAPETGDAPPAPGMVPDREGRLVDAALVDPAVLSQLGVAVGDTIVIGGRSFRIEGTVEAAPTDLAVQTAIGPRVWIGGGALEAMDLLGVGSLARHEAFLRLPEGADRRAVRRRYRDVLRSADVSWTTAPEQARDLVRTVDVLGRYLGLVGLAALLLGGIGVASAVHVYAREGRERIAVLRCLGARQRTVFLSYLLQAGGLGLLGAAAGAGMGVAVQYALPALASEQLPVAVDPRFAPLPVAAGIATGVGVALLFAIPPLLEVRRVSPLQALRVDFEPSSRRERDPWRFAAYLGLAAGITGISVVETDSLRNGFAFALGIALALGALRATAGLAIHFAGRMVPRRARYPFRQGIANLFRPRNQTIAVTLALGFGTFVVGAVLQVEASLSAALELDVEEGQPNLVLFDIQPDQVDAILELVRPVAEGEVRLTPVVPARIARIRGLSIDELRGLPGSERPARWALRREYRHTYRREMTESETLVEGSWFDRPDTDAVPGGAARARGGQGRRSAEPARISVEYGLAEDLGLRVGDGVTWDVAGREVASVVTSLRDVEWHRFSTNFFVVFEPGPLDDAPQMAVALAHVADRAARGGLQRDLAEAFPNVSTLDVSHVQEAVGSILRRVAGAIRFLAFFAAAAGLLVLAGALATSRDQRRLEAALLRTLGARRGQVLQVLLAEYAAIGVLGGLSGLLLAVPAAWWVVRGMFSLPYVPSVPAFLGVWLGVAVLAVLVGLSGMPHLLRRPPLPVLREAAG